MLTGDLVKTKRLELGLTLEEVGEAVGVGKSTVRKWETGMIANMKRDKIALLAKTLRLNPADLIDAEPVTALSYKEITLLQFFRNAETAFQDEAIEMLRRHQKEKTRQPAGTD